MESPYAKIIGTNRSRPRIALEGLRYQCHPYPLRDQFGDCIQFVQLAHVAGIEMGLTQKAINLPTTE